MSPASAPSGYQVPNDMEGIGIESLSQWKREKNPADKSELLKGELRFVVILLYYL